MFENRFDWVARYDTAPEGGETTGGDKSFTQEQVNTFLANERKSQEAKYLKQMEELGGNLKLTEEQKKALEGQVQTIKQQSDGEVNVLKGEINKLKEKSSKDAKALEDDRNAWRNRYVDARITSELLTAASSSGAYNPTQVVALLRGNTELVERFDDKGKGLGEFDVRVKRTVKGEDGKETLVALSPADALKGMLEDVDNFGNLFKSNLKTGLGGSGSAGGTITINNIEDYKKMRAQITGNASK